MAIGERIHYFRNLRGMTQKYLGMAIGFPEKSADIRMAQYESGTRSPKEEITEKLAQALDVSPKALDVPDIDSYVGLMHTLFALEDIYLAQGKSIRSRAFYLDYNRVAPPLPPESGVMKLEISQGGNAYARKRLDG